MVFIKNFIIKDVFNEFNIFIFINITKTKYNIQYDLFYE